jgi:hercynine metabolism protein
MSQSGGDWLKDLEHQLNEGLDAFLRANPGQRDLLEEQESRDRRQRLMEQRRRLRQDADLQRQGLLRLAEDIRQWQGRVAKARAASADALARRAEAHIAGLMEEGRNRWTSLRELGERYSRVEGQLEELRLEEGGPAAAGRREAEGAAGPATAAGDGGSGTSPGASLEDDWAAFEARQELEELRRRMAR